MLLSFCSVFFSVVIHKLHFPIHDMFRKTTDSTHVTNLDCTSNSQKQTNAGSAILAGAKRKMKVLLILTYFDTFLKKKIVP